MHRLSALAALCLLLPVAALAQDAGVKPSPPAKAAAKPPAKAAAKPKKKPAAPAADAAAPADAAAAAGAAAATPGATGAATLAPASDKPPVPLAPAIDPEEFRRQVMEEVRRELQKTRDEVKQETAWVEQDSQARVQDSEAVEALKQRVNLFQPHGYFRTRYEFFNNLDLGRGADPGGYTLFPRPFIGANDSNHSQSDANMRFRFEPQLEVSEDLSIYAQVDILDNILYGSDPSSDIYLDPFTPLAALSNTRASSAVHVKRLWGRVNTQLGELVFGRMGYHWGLGILHNDGSCLDCDYGDTYDRVAFTPRDFRGHKLTVMMDVLDKGAITDGEHGELGRSVDVDTLDDGYRLAVEIVKLDTADEARRKLDAGEWVVNYGLLADYRTQSWDSPGLTTAQPAATLGNFGALRAETVQRKAKIYQPDVFLSLRKRKFRLDLEIASTLGSVGTRAVRDADTVSPDLSQQLTFFQMGGALQSDFALLPADALLLGVEIGAASGDKGVYGFGARPWRNGSGAQQGTQADGTPFRATAQGDIDGPHYDFSNPAHSHGHINNFIFNRAYNVDMILFRNIVSSVSSAWYLKPSLRYRPTGRKTGGGDDTGFELTGSIMYSQAFYEENTPGLSKPLGIEANVGITYDTSDRFHTGLQYGLLLPFSGLKNQGFGPNGSLVAAHDAGIAHALRAIVAIPF